MKFKKVFVLLSFIFTAVSMYAVDYSKKERFVVVPFRDSAKIEENLSENMTSSIASKLAELGRFEIVDRREIEKVIEEQKLIELGMTDMDTIETGKILSAKLIFTGDIISVTTQNELEEQKKKQEEEKKNKIKRGLEGVAEALTEEKETKKADDRWKAKITVSVKLLEVETGKTLESFTKEAEYRVSGKVNTKEAAINGAIKELSEAIIMQMRYLFKIESYIMEKDKKTATIRLGKDMGIKEGMEFLVYPPKIKEKDKYTGEEITREGSKKGVLYITDVSENTAKAKIARGASKIEEGDRLLEKPMMTFNLELSGGVAPFKMKKADFKAVSYDYTVKVDQEEKETVPYLNLRISPAYRPMRMSLDLNMMINDPIMVYGLGLNLELSRDITDFVEVTVGGGIGLKYGTGKIGSIVGSIDGGSKYKYGEDVKIEGFAFDVKLLSRIAVALSETTSVFAQADYNIVSSISSWEATTKNDSDEEVEIEDFSSEIGKLDMTGLLIGGGLRFTF